MYRKLSGALCAFACSVVTSHHALAAAPAYPERTITMVVSFAPGGATDISTRILSAPLSKTLGQQIVIENRPGAGGIIAVNAVQRAKPDGYTLLATSSVYVVTPSLNKQAAYDPIKDFVPVIEIGAAPNVFVTRPDSNINTVADLIAQAKTNPNLISYGSPGTGTTPHLAGEILKIRANVNMTHIAYAGGAPAVQAVVGRQIQVMVASLSSVMPQISSGLLKPIVQTGRERWPDLPNTPTTTEAGIKDAVSDTFQAIFAPAGTPPEAIATLARESTVILKQPDVIERLKQAGLAVTARGPDGLRARVAEEVPKWRDVVEKAGIKAE